MAWFALGVAATTIGVARAAREYAVAFARERTPNSQRTIREYPGVRMRIARIDLLLQRSRALVFDAARTWEASERFYRDVRAGLHNPPLEDRALEMLARSALDD
jgi:alkylation response protein AidB-like acyl-CoA dehydrogenase